MDVRAVVWFLDYNGGEASLTINPPQGASHEVILAGVQRVCERLDSISLAEITRVRVIYVDDALNLTPAQPGSDVYTRLICIFSEGSEWGSIAIPSVGALPFDEDGPYRDIRVTREALLLSGMLGVLEDLVSGTVRQDGSEFPSTYYVGGTTRIVP